MKKRNLILSIIVIVSILFIHNVNAANGFTDPDFEQCVNNAVASDPNASTVAQIKTLNCASNKAITDVTGLSQLTALEELNLSGTKITTINFDQLTNMKKVVIYDVPELTEIHNLWVSTALELVQMTLVI